MAERKRSTIYFEPEIHQALRMRSAATRISVSELVNEAVRVLIREDQEDLEAYKHRTRDPEITYAQLLANLKKNGKI